MPLGEVPSPEDTADLFTLSPDQRTPFLQLAYTFLCELRGQPTEPLRLLITGDAGTGKTHIIAAFEWFAFQHRGSHLVLVVSYMWRAAMNVTTPSNIALSTTTTFALGRVKHSAVQGASFGHAMYGPNGHAALRARTETARFIFIEEYGVLGLAHFADVCTRMQDAARHQRPDPTPLDPFSLRHLHLALTGDPRQHVAPGALAMLVHHPPKGSATSPVDTLRGHGQDFLATFKQVYYLQQQHRRDETQAGGLELGTVAHMFDGLGKATPEQVYAAVEQLNRRALTAQALQQLRNPHVVLLRHSVQLFVNRRLAERQAAADGQPIYIWRSHDRLQSYGTVPPALAAELEFLPWNKTAHTPTLGMFFRGMEYAFGDSKLPGLHRCTNNSAFGVTLVLHDDEPEPSTEPGVHVLQYMPKGIVVRPGGPPLGTVCSPTAAGEDIVPRDCILVPRETHSFEVLHEGVMVSVTRTGIPLLDGYAVTDYAAQGANFGSADWIAHLNIPHDVLQAEHGRTRTDKRAGTMSRASIFVILTRFRDWDSLHLLAPLWQPGDEEAKQAVMTKFLQLAAREEGLAREIERLQALAAEQRQVVTAQLEELRRRAAAGALARGTTAMAAAAAAMAAGVPQPLHTAA